MDGRNVLMIMGVMLLVLIGWGWPMLAAAYFEHQEKKKRGEPPRFDERQKLARQQAGNRALFVLIGFLTVWVCVDLGGWFVWTGSVLDLVLCALPLTWGVWSADCILHDAFLGWKEKNSSDVISLTFAAMITNSIGPFWVGGLLKSSIPYFFAVGTMLALGGVLLYKRFLRPRLTRQDEGDGL